MLRFVPAALVLALLAALVATSAVTAQTTSSSSSNCVYVRLSLDNPVPGAQIPPGPYMIQGMAQDIRAGQGGNGISRVQLFLGSRESGGPFLGQATFSNPSSPIFTVNAGMPSTGLGPTVLTAIATSSVDGKDYTIDVPFTLAFPALPGNTGGQVMGLPPLCQSGQTPSGNATATPTSGGGGGGSSSTSSGPLLNVIAPPARASILAGPYSVSGTASDPAASSGSGVDRVQIFLDSRESGGQWLGDATLGSPGTNGWQANVSLPTNNTGVHAIFVYARSSVTGKETIVSVPVIISIS
jgi:hypothetical protein